METTRGLTGRMVKLGVTIGCIFSLGLPTVPVWAADQTNEVKKLAPVFVTGSNIPTLEAIPIAPVARIDEAAIERSGAATVTEVLRKIPQTNGNGTFQETQASSFTPGSATVALRGLGAQRTLVL